MSASPRVSVIVAVFNGAATLRRCLDSVLGQTYPDVELVVMDGGSSDGSVDVLRSYGDRIAFWESAPDRGIYHAWNKALAHASGEWVCFLGADDRFWGDDVVARMVRALPHDASGARVVYGQAAVLSPSGCVVRYEGRPWEDARRDLPWYLSLPHPGLFHHRQIFERHGGFDEAFQIAGDHELLWRELKSGQALYVPDVVVVGFQHGGVSHSPGAMAALLRELAALRRKHRVRLGWRRLFPPKVYVKMAASALAFRLIGDAGFRRVADGLRRLRGRPAVWNAHSAGGRG